MGEYREQDTDIAMGEVSTGSEYSPILGNHYIPKAQIKLSDIMNEHHATYVISGCSVTCQVWHEEGFGRNFIHCGSDDVFKYFGLERISGDSIVNDIGL